MGTIDFAAVTEACEAVRRQGGTAGVAIAIDGAFFDEWNGNRRFAPASTIKIAVMLEIFHAVEQGRITRDDLIAMKQRDKVQGSGVLQGMHAGLEVTVDDLLYLMISISDNTATNMLADLVGLEAINAAMRALGMEQSVMNRKMLGRKPGPGDPPENWVTPREMALLSAAILEGKAASAESTAAMRALLRTQTNTRRIARFVPEGVEWGSKTGSLDKVVNDVGYVSTDRGTIVLSIFIEGLGEIDGEDAIARIARAAWTAASILPE